jgi:thiol-disulfide isomerase/thioredoxin
VSLLRRRAAGVTLASRSLAPEFIGVNQWLNSSGPVRVRGLYGQVVLLEFWSLGCGNCVRTLPFMVKMHARYRARGLVVVGIHTPEFRHEASLGAVRAAVASHGLHYAVGLDNAYATWDTYGVEFWPTVFVVDRGGAIAHRHVGEGGYGHTERVVNRLLGEPEPTTSMYPASNTNGHHAPRTA